MGGPILLRKGTGWCELLPMTSPATKSQEEALKQVLRHGDSVKQVVGFRPIDKRATTSDEDVDGVVEISGSNYKNRDRVNCQL